MPLSVAPVVDRFKQFRTFPQLKTKRMNLRQLTLDDVEWYLRHFSTPEIIEGQGFEGPDGFKGAERELREYCIAPFTRREGFRWGLELKADRKLIGSAGYYKWFPETPHRAQLGYDLDPDYWGQGLMSEALSAIIGFGFGQMKLGRIEVLIGPHNKNSIRLARRMGFRKEGVLREYSLDEHGLPQDDIMFSLLKDEHSPKGRRRAPRKS